MCLPFIYFLDATRSLYSDSSSCVRVNGQLNDFFTFLAGVCQGCLLAPDLFDISVDWLLDHTIPRFVPGVSIGLDYFSDLDYADDAALLAELVELLEPTVLTFSTESSKLGLQMSWKKTVVQSLSDSQSCSPRL